MVAVVIDRVRCLRHARPSSHVLLHIQVRAGVRGFTGAHPPAFVSRKTRTSTGPVVGGR